MIFSMLKAETHILMIFSMLKNYFIYIIYIILIKIIKIMLKHHLLAKSRNFKVFLMLKSMQIPSKLSENTDF